MGRLLVIYRLAVRDLQRRRGEVVLVLLALAVASVTLTLGLVLRGVTSNPFLQTRAATAGPDVVAAFLPPQRAQALDLEQAPGVTGHAGPYPVGWAFLRAGSIRTTVMAEGQNQALASLDQPKVIQGTWVRPGGVVVEGSFAAASGARVGQAVTLNGHRFRIDGIAVSAALPEYPQLCSFFCDLSFNSTNLVARDTGLVWLTTHDARSLATRALPLSYQLDLRLQHPAQAQRFANAQNAAHLAGPFLLSWQNVSDADALLIADERQVLLTGSWLLALLAVASVAVLVGGRMADQTRRVGLLKAVGATPRLVATVLLAENLVLAIIAAIVGLVIGRLIAPLLTSPGAGLVGTPNSPSLSGGTIGLTIGVAVAVALVATAVPALRAARVSTIAALANYARLPRRGTAAIAVSAALPVALLLGLRLLARRPRRAVLSATSIAVTVAAIVAVLTYRAQVDQQKLSSTGLNSPVTDRLGQVLLVLTIVGLVLAAVNAIFIAWATVLDARRASAIARALGATPREVIVSLSVAQVLPAVPAAIVGIPAGIGLFALVNSGGGGIPPLWWLAVVLVATPFVVAGLTAIPARMGGGRPVAEILRLEPA